MIITSKIHWLLPIRSSPKQFSLAQDYLEAAYEKFASGTRKNLEIKD